MPTAWEISLEAVGVTRLAIQLWTAVLILCRPANHVGGHGLGGCQMHAVYIFFRSQSSSQIVCMVAMTLAFTQSSQTFILQDCLPYM